MCGILGKLFTQPWSAKPQAPYSSYEDVHRKHTQIFLGCSSYVLFLYNLGWFLDALHGATWWHNDCNHWNFDLLAQITPRLPGGASLLLQEPAWGAHRGAETCRVGKDTLYNQGDPVRGNRRWTGQFSQEMGLKWGLLHVTNTGHMSCFVVLNGISVPS